MNAGRGKKKSTRSGKEGASDSGPQPPDRKTVKKAERFLKDVKKLLKRHGEKLEAGERSKLQTAIEGVESALAGSEDGKRLSSALKELDARAEQSLGRFKKSTAQEYAESIIIAVLIAVVLRAFVVEAFKIPTGSMIPTLEVGDHIFVNKFIYGLRIPFTNSWFVEWGSPERGDVIVFRYPLDLSKDYIKRVVAVSGDKIWVKGRGVYINGQRLEQGEASNYGYVDESEDESGSTYDGPMIRRRAKAYCEQSLTHGQRYTVIYQSVPEELRRPFPDGDNLPGLTCTQEEGGAGYCMVKDGFVFVMGDNRDNSSDGRVWGAVPSHFVKGKAMFIWWSRGPKTGIRWSRMGSSVHQQSDCGHPESRLPEP